MYPVFVHRLAHLIHASFRPRLAAVALASSLGLHLHQVGRRTCTSKLLSMPSTQRSGLACGFGHRRFACGNLQASGLLDEVASDYHPAPTAVSASVLFSSNCNTNSIALRLLRHSFKPRYRKRPGEADLRVSTKRNAPGRLRYNAKVSQPSSERRKRFVSRTGLSLIRGTNQVEGV